jgi:hypothetical protein
MVLFKEVWLGKSDHGNGPPLHKVNIGDSHRASAEEHSGSFHCLTLTTALVPGDLDDRDEPGEGEASAGSTSGSESDADSQAVAAALAGSAAGSFGAVGTAGEPTKAFFSGEVVQQWAAPEGSFGEGGVTWWLPHGACWSHLKDCAR